MEIGCKVQIVNAPLRDNPSLPEGKYLVLDTDKTKKSVYISYDDFMALHTEAKQQKAIAPIDVGIGTGVSILSGPKESRSPQFGTVLSFLVQQIKIQESDIEEEENITVSSEWGIFLELPWEQIVNKTVYVIRKYPGSNNESFVKPANNLLILMSHAHEGVGRDIKNGMDAEVKTIYQALHFLTENNQHSFRVDSILLSKHTTKQSLLEADLARYNILHFVMHGKDDGSLCLEHEDRRQYKYPDPISVDELVQILAGKTYTLVFLASCYSGGGITGDESLAFKLVKSSLSQFVIGYANPVGEQSAKSFTESFYELIITGRSIKEVYIEAMRRYYAIRKAPQYIPLLYTSE